VDWKSFTAIPSPSSAEAGIHTVPVNMNSNMDKRIQEILRNETNTFFMMDFLSVTRNYRGYAT
jgi:hypothetical protein